MKPTEAAALLTIAAAYDNRKPDADQAKAWAMALEGIRFEDARIVIVEHYKRSREWLVPVDVIQGVKRLRDQRLSDYGPMEPPASLDPDDTEGYARWFISTRQAIADGALAAPEPGEIGTHRDVIAELGHIGHEIPGDDRMDRETAMQAARAALRSAGSEEDEG